MKKETNNTKTRMKNGRPVRHHRSIWVSDVHLGTPGCKAEYLADFLKYNTCDQLYLVGDIIDGWRIRSSFYWPQEHSNVIRRILTQSKRGTRVTYVTGNHDEFLRKFVDYGLTMGNIRIVNEAVHKAADGRQLLITHGDLFDVITRYHRWLAFTGDKAYDTLLWLNIHLNRFRARMGMPYWSLAAYTKQKVKTAVNFISEFEEALAYECRKRGLDGVVCGHIHHAEIRDIEGVTYHNCGDWVESCTALVEDQQGKISILPWAEIGHARDAADRSGKVIDLNRAA